MRSPRVELIARPASAAGGGPLVSVIIPLAPEEAIPEPLLALLPDTMEIILARGGTRAHSMNLAARTAKGNYLWFLHADSQIAASAIARLLERLALRRDALLYFDLAFDGGPLMRLTETGVWIRSHLLGLPFGDQAFCIPTGWFHQLGAYDELTACGEDHLLVWSAHQSTLPVEPVGASVVTSARKYRSQGWTRTTLQHLRMTVQQAMAARRSRPGRKAATPTSAPRAG